jgi:tetratricopeptide (TPR) repeat protein
VTGSTTDPPGDGGSWPPASWRDGWLSEPGLLGDLPPGPSSGPVPDPLPSAGDPLLTTDAVWAGIERADALPHGRERTARLEELAGRVDAAGDLALGTAVRLSLVQACLNGGEHQRVPELLDWLLARYDEGHPWFGPWERHGVLFSFTAATVGLLQHPDVPLDRLQATTALMADRYAAAGESPAPVLRARFLLAQQLHGPAAAQVEFERWLATPRSELSECAECERAEQVRQLAATGRHEEAVALARPVLDAPAPPPDAAPAGPDGAQCEASPVSLIAAVLESLLVTGMSERAAREHVRAVRLIPEVPADAAPRHIGRADHLLVCARAGRLQRGLDLIEYWLPWYSQAAPPSTRLQFAAAAARLMRGLAEAGYGGLAVTPPEPYDGSAGPALDPTTVDELGARLAREARDLAARFDARNGTGQVGDRLEQVLDAGLLPDLPLDALGRSPRFARVRTAGEAAGPPGRTRRGRRAAGRQAAPSVDPKDLEALATRFDEALAADAQPAARAVLDAWRTVRTQPVVPGQEAAAARLDAWLSIDELSRGARPEVHPADRYGSDPLGLDPVTHPLADPLTDPLPSEQPRLLTDFALAAEWRLRAAGLAIESRLHEQAALLVLAQTTQAERVGPAATGPLAAPSPVPLPDALDGAPGWDFAAAMARMEELAVEVGELSGPGDAGLALSRVVLLRELAPAVGLPVPETALPEPVTEFEAHELPGAAVSADPTHITLTGPLTTGPAAPKPRVVTGDPLDAALEALRSVPSESLDHQRLRALCRLLRIRAADEPPETKLDTLRSAIAVLPDGVRPLERALAGADLAGALQEGDPAAALAAWDRAASDAAAAGAQPVLGNLLAAGATLRHALGDPEGAAHQLFRAVPLLDEHAAPPLAAQARFDLARALLDLGRDVEAAEVAESALADLTDLLREVPAAEAPVEGGRPSPSGPKAELHLAGCAAFAAAEANAATGDRQQARALALLSAAWHERNHNLIAQAEAWQLAARLGGPARQLADDLGRAAALAEAGGDWARAATCRRERVIALKDAAGLEAAFGALDEADAALRERDENPAGRHAPAPEQNLAERQLRWHRLAIAEQRARLLAVAGRFTEALAVVKGLEDEYVQLGDDWSARDLMGLRGQLRAELGDLDGALDDLRLAAESAMAAGDRPQAHGLGERLAAVLDEAGRPEDAESAWQRYCEPGPAQGLP